METNAPFPCAKVRPVADAASPQAMRIRSVTVTGLKGKRRNNLSIAVGAKMRKLTQSEFSVVRTLGGLIADDMLRNQFLLDINEVEVTDEAPDGSRLMFHLPDVQLQAYRGQDSFRGRDGFPVEGKLLDADGESIDVYFYHVDGRMFELELLRPDGQPVMNPNWTSFTVN